MSYPYSGINAVTLGSYAGSTLQSTSAIALGYNAGASSQGASAIAIGSYAGYVNQPASSIVMNATGSTLNGANANATYIAPLRNVAASTVMCYDPVNKEATYSNVVQCSTLTVSSISGVYFPVPISLGTLVGTNITHPTSTTWTWSFPTNLTRRSATSTYVFQGYVSHQSNTNYTSYAYALVIYDTVTTTSVYTQTVIASLGFNPGVVNTNQIIPIMWGPITIPSANACTIQIVATGNASTFYADGANPANLMVTQYN
jgi:hypothetical protein